MPVTISPNMSMPVPNVGQDPGPDWANNINACLSIVDSHNHNLGTGLQITPLGLNINTDLPFNSNNATLLRSVRFASQSAALALASDVGCLYEVGVDLYYNDGAGNQIRITQGGTVTGSTGTITGLPSGTASASYSSGTFTFQSATNTPATLSVGTTIIRNLTAGSFGVSLMPINALPADYSLTLPTLPASQKIMTLDNSGNITAPYVVDNATLTIASNTIKVADLGVGTTQLAANSVTAAKIANNVIGSGQTINGSQIITATGAGTFNVPANINVLYVYGAGGGGGGAGGQAGAGNTAGGCGGNGVQPTLIRHAVTPGAALSYSVATGGAGGAPSAPGTVGGATTFDTLTFYGGQPGVGLGAPANYIFQLGCWFGAIQIPGGQGGPAGGSATAGRDGSTSVYAAGGPQLGIIGTNSSGGGGGAGIGVGGSGGQGGGTVNGTNGGTCAGGGGGGGGGAGGTGGTGGNGYLAIYW